MSAFRKQSAGVVERLEHYARVHASVSDAVGAGLGQAIRGGRLGVSFRRQVQIGPYIVDVVAPSADVRTRRQAARPEARKPDYGYFELFVDAAERAIDAHIRTPDGGLVDSLCGHPGGRRADTRTLNLGWSQPFQRIEGTGELKAQLIAELKAATTREGVQPPPKATQRRLELHA